MTRAVLVTGASRGIGRAIAQAFARQGDRVAVHYRDSAGLAREVLAALPGRGHTIVRADLADAEAVRQMVDQAAADLGGLDVLVNNAGIYPDRDVSILTVSRDQLTTTFQTNTFGAVIVTQAFL
ncbi:MAG TPA: SDR family oxidoreductase, partial [Streptosporangiaceae bacterium]|nr:SDR family oxidoreductase [Streptosporangiaceae bacterium]